MRIGIKGRLPLLGAMIVSSAASVAWAAQPATQPSQQDLQSQVNELKAEVAQLKNQQNQNQADLAAAMKEVIADADRHSQMLDMSGGVTAGWADGRFFIQSENGDFTFKPWIHVQVRDSTSYRNGNYDIENGIEVRRARLGFDGNIFGHNLTYFINWATNRANSSQTVTDSGGDTSTVTNVVGGVPVLEEAWLKYRFGDGPFYAHVGQMHDPLDHENIVGSKYRAPEASLQGDIYGNTDTFCEAITLIYDPKTDVRIEDGINHGIRSANTNYVGWPSNAYTGGFAGRIEYKVMGNWHDYDQLTAYRDTKDLLVVGSGYDYSYASAYSTLCQTADVQYGNPDGCFAYICYFGRYTNHQIGIPNTSNPGASFGGSPADLGKDTYEPTVDAQFAYLMPFGLEPYVRYEYMDLAGTPAGSQNNVTDITLGANYYIYGHNLKLTGQVMYLPNGIPISDSSSDVLSSNDKAEFILITQVQLLI